MPPQPGETLVSKPVRADESTRENRTAEIQPAIHEEPVIAERARSLYGRGLLPYLTNIINGTVLTIVLWGSGILSLSRGESTGPADYRLRSRRNGRRKHRIRVRLPACFSRFCVACAGADHHPFSGQRRAIAHRDGNHDGLVRHRDVAHRCAGWGDTHRCHPFAD